MLESPIRSLRRVILIRHGQSLGNVDRAKYSSVPDPAISLSEHGHQQALEAGVKLGEFLNEFSKEHPEIIQEKFGLWYSPYMRAVQSKDNLLRGLGDDNLERFVRGNGYESDFLREQSFGDWNGLDNKAKKEQYPKEFKEYSLYRRNHFGYYFCPPGGGGESREMVCLRAQRFVGLVKERARQKNDPVPNIIVVAHGVSIRAIQKELRHLGHEWFDNSSNPNNCEIRMIAPDEQGNYSDHGIIFEGFSDKDL
jgi:2,3-bisphosphoglycerate-dependent phosphoglycerate mutase